MGEGVDGVVGVGGVDDGVVEGGGGEELGGEGGEEVGVGERLRMTVGEMGGRKEMWCTTQKGVGGEVSMELELREVDVEEGGVGG
ncbi:hypothetical protein, partial [Kocuria salsicia]|uniref:hypothetical protein n=1 Tax=Kocuria salsicia TaxID=664639 RepID=UPI001643942C